MSSTFGEVFRLTEPVKALKRPISDRIHNAIKERIARVRFSRVEFRQGLRYTLHHKVERAKTILVRSLSRAFLPAARNRLPGGALQEIDAWIWVALVHFDGQVNLDKFEEDLLHDPILIERDGELGQQIRVSLLDATDEHPPEREGAHGTRVTYRFQADLSPL